MPPKAKILKKHIIEGSLNIVRREGMSRLNARNIAKEIKYSTQPIYTYYATMEELKADVLKAASDYFDNYLAECVKHRKGTSAYGAIGLGYIQFAKEEKELFKLLFMQDNIYGQTWEQEQNSQIEMVMAATGLSRDDAKNFHLQMWIFAHGIATFFATSYLDISDELIDEFLTRVSSSVLETYK